MIQRSADPLVLGWLEPPMTCLELHQLQTTIQGTTVQVYPLESVQFVQGRDHSNGTVDLPPYQARLQL